MVSKEYFYIPLNCKFFGFSKTCHDHKLRGPLLSNLLRVFAVVQIIIFLVTIINALPSTRHFVKAVNMVYD